MRATAVWIDVCSELTGFPSRALHSLRRLSCTVLDSFYLLSGVSFRLQFRYFPTQNRRLTVKTYSEPAATPNAFWAVDMTAVDRGSDILPPWRCPPHIKPSPAVLGPLVRIEAAQRSFATNGPTTWNSLPLVLPAPELSQNAFISALKTVAPVLDRPAP